jgi:hypothetical protein
MSKGNAAISTPPPISFVFSDHCFNITCSGDGKEIN